MGIEEELEESQRICGAATGGPWEQERYIWKPNMRVPDHPRQAVRTDEGEIMSVWESECNEFEDATFIAHARTALPLRNRQLAAVLDFLHRLEDGASENYIAANIRRAIKGAG